MAPSRKLVRDRIPALMEERGIGHRVVVVSGDAYHAALVDKLREEVEEYASAASDEAAVAELADVVEVVLALAGERGVTAEELERVRRAKADERGGFRGRLVVELDP